MPTKKPAPAKGTKSKKGKKKEEPKKGKQLSDDELSEVSGGMTLGTLTNPLGGPIVQPLDLSVRKLTEADLLRVSGGFAPPNDQGGKSRQTVCR